jgi:excisionase family DNA binding protein
MSKPGSLKYAADRIGVSLPTLYKLIDEKKRRTYHIGRAHRVSDEAIADCISQLERESAGKAA